MSVRSPTVREGNIGIESVPSLTVGLLTESASHRNSMTQEAIEVRGARVNNLKNISFSIPHNQLTVVTGVSGSGKSSLAFDTIYAEGQRRYVESLSAYARQFLERMDKPDVDEVRGIAPAIAIRQKNSTRNPRSTVSTQTEIYDYLRLLYARVGITICRVCGREVRRDSPESAADEILNQLNEGTRFFVLFPAQAGLAVVGSRGCFNRWEWLKACDPKEQASGHWDRQQSTSPAADHGPSHELDAARLYQADPRGQADRSFIAG